MVIKLVDNKIVELLKQEIGQNSIISHSHPKERRIFIAISYLCLREAITFLKNNGFSHLSAITGAQVNNDQIEILYHLDHNGNLLTLKVVLPLVENTIPTISDIITGALLYEREIHDLFGIQFSGHPALKKLILPDEWNEQSYPLKN